MLNKVVIGIFVLIFFCNSIFFAEECFLLKKYKTFEPGTKFVLTMLDNEYGYFEFSDTEIFKDKIGNVSYIVYQQEIKKPYKGLYWNYGIKGINGNPKYFPGYEEYFIPRDQIFNEVKNGH